MTRRRLLLAAAGTVAGIFLTLVFTLILVPSREIGGLVARGFERQGYTFQAARFGKAFPLGVSAKGVQIAGERGTLLRLDRASVRLSLLPLLTGQLVCAFDGQVGSGRISGEYSLRKNGKGSLEVRGVRLEDVPFFKTVAGAEAKGIMSVDASLRGTPPQTSGELRLEVKGAELRGVKIAETPLPDASYETVRGMVRIASARAVLESFALQGEGIYIRLKGDFPLSKPLGASPLNLTLELMPQPAFLDRQKLVFMLLAKYLVTPGHYQLPIRGTLAKPILQ